MVNRTHLANNEIASIYPRSQGAKHVQKYLLDAILKDAGPMLVLEI